jgi:hypothetical protein
MGRHFTYPPFYQIVLPRYIRRRRTERFNMALSKHPHRISEQTLDGKIPRRIYNNVSDKTLLSDCNEGNGSVRLLVFCFQDILRRFRRRTFL